MPLGAVAPPTLDAPVFDCAEKVVVRGYDSGATLNVYVAGVLRGTKTGDFPTSFSRALVSGESLTATVDHCRLGIQASEPHPVNQL